MSKSNKILLVVFIVLGGVYLANKYWLSSGNRNFKTTLVALDTALVTKIEVISPENDKKPVVLTKQGMDWLAESGSIKDEADKSVVNGMLIKMVSMNPDRLLGSSKAQWDANQVSDSLATHVKVYANDDLLADFYVGKFNFQPTSRTMSTSVRLVGEEEVYAVEGYLAAMFNKAFDGFRDKTFIHTTPEDVESVQFIYPEDSSFTLSKTLSGWSVDGVEVDSLTVRNYIKGLSQVKFRKFRDDFAASSTSPLYSMVIATTNKDESVVSVYQDEQGMTIHSSQNDNAYFTDEGVKVFDKLLVPRAKFKKPGE